MIYYCFLCYSIVRSLTIHLSISATYLRIFDYKEQILLNSSDAFRSSVGMDKQRNHHLHSLKGHHAHILVVFFTFLVIFGTPLSANYSAIKPHPLLFSSLFSLSYHRDLLSLLPPRTNLTHLTFLSTPYLSSITVRYPIVTSSPLSLSLSPLYSLTFHGPTWSISPVRQASYGFVFSCVPRHIWAALPTCESASLGERSGRESRGRERKRRERKQEGEVNLLPCCSDSSSVICLLFGPVCCFSANGSWYGHRGSSPGEFVTSFWVGTSSPVS